MDMTESIGIDALLTAKEVSTILGVNTNRRNSRLHSLKSFVKNWVYLKWEPSLTSTVRLYRSRRNGHDRINRH